MVELTQYNKLNLTLQSVTGHAYACQRQIGLQINKTHDRFWRYQLKYLHIIILAACVLILGSCSDSTEPNDPEAGTIEFHGDTYHFGNVDCWVSGTVGGPIVYSLFVSFTDGIGRNIDIGIQDPENDPANLLELGEHFATGQHWDEVANGLTDSHFSIGYLDSSQLSLVWEMMDVGERTFSGSGYIHIKQRLNLACADSIWSDGSFVGPGDPGYDLFYEHYCEPGYFYPEQKILFSCQDSRY